MDVESLRWFQQVADGVTVTEVADIYLVSQPGVSRALARLEQEVGTPLLHRSGRVLRPTHAGAVFKRHVDILLHELDDGLAAVNELHDPETGTVRLAFQLSLGGWLVPELVASFRRTHPQVRFTLEQSHDALGSSLVAGGRTDLEITARRPRNPEVEWRHLVSQRLDLAVPAAHPLASREAVALADAADEDFVMLRLTWELRAVTDALCTDAGFAPRVAFEGDDLRTVAGFVAAGLGVAVMPAGDDTLTGPRNGVRMLPLSDEGAFRDVGVAWSRTRRLLPSAEEFRRHVLAAHRSG